VFAFDPDSVEVKGSTASFLADVIRGLAASPHITLVGIEGFANARERLPRQLSERRARVIRDALVAAGVDPARLKIRASGVGKPQTICGGCACEEAANRVVEFVVLRRTDDLPTWHFSSDPPGKR
jgi:outer membrane protein OmpA-like peptidoglycan-associated protein